MSNQLITERLAQTAARSYINGLPVRGGPRCASGPRHPYYRVPYRSTGGLPALCQALFPELPLIVGHLWLDLTSFIRTLIIFDLQV